MDLSDLCNGMLKFVIGKSFTRKVKTKKSVMQFLNEVARPVNPALSFPLALYFEMRLKRY